MSDLPPPRDSTASDAQSAGDQGGSAARGRQQLAIGLAILLYALLADAAIETAASGSPVRWWVAIAILADTPAILLDEPTSGLDPKAGLEFIGILRSLREEGKAILMSTHDLFRAKQVADRIGIMNGGRLVAERTRAELEHEDLEDLYVSFMTGYMDGALSTNSAA